MNVERKTEGEKANRRGNNQMVSGEGAAGDWEK